MSTILKAEERRGSLEEDDEKSGEEEDNEQGINLDKKSRIKFLF